MWHLQFIHRPSRQGFAWSCVDCSNIPRSCNSRIYILDMLYSGWFKCIYTSCTHIPRPTLNNCRYSFVLYKCTCVWSMMSWPQANIRIHNYIYICVYGRVTYSCTWITPLWRLLITSCSHILQSLTSRQMCIYIYIYILYIYYIYTEQHMWYTLCLITVSFHPCVCI